MPDILESIYYLTAYRFDHPKEEDTHFHAIEHILRLRRATGPNANLNRYFATLGEIAARQKGNPYLHLLEE